MKKEKVEFRYYEIPSDMSMIALLGQDWIQRYGNDAMHFHNCLEIGYCYYGQGKMYFGQRAVDYGTGCITVIPKNSPHHTKQTNEEPNRWEYLFVDSETFLQNAYHGAPKYANVLDRRLNGKMFLIPGGRDSEAEMLIRLIFEEMRNKDRLYKHCVEGMLKALLLKIIRLVGDGKDLAKESAAASGYGAILDVLNYIEDHYMEELRMEDLARLSHMSISNFRRKFQSCMNTAPAEYINLVRVEKACKMLRMTEDGVKEIAVKSGFCTTETFIRNFKKLTGLSPLQWKKAEKQGETNLQNYNVTVLKGW